MKAFEFPVIEVLTIDVEDIIMQSEVDTDSFDDNNVGEWN